MELWHRTAEGKASEAASARAPNLYHDDIVGAVHCHRYRTAAPKWKWRKRHRMAGRFRLSTLAVEYVCGASPAKLCENTKNCRAQRTFGRWIRFSRAAGIEADICPAAGLLRAQFLDRLICNRVPPLALRYVNAETDRVESFGRSHITILGHPTGRLLLTREPYAIDIEAVIRKAGAVGVAIELNADPHRVDIDWRMCRLAKKSGTLVSIGPDAHSPQGLENAALGIATARKGWLEAGDVLNSRTATQG